MDNLQSGIEALKAGDRANAKRLLSSAVTQYPDNERAWGWLYNASDTDEEKRRCLENMTRINPGNQKPRELLAAMSAPAPVTEALQDAAVKKFPYCAEIVQPEATVCKHCGKNIAPTMMVGEQLKTLGASLTALGGIVFTLLCMWLCYSVMFAK